MDPRKVVGELANFWCNVCVSWTNLCGQWPCLDVILLGTQRFHADGC